MDHMVRHGLSMGIERLGDDFYLSFKIIGQLKHDDYEAFTPFLEAAIAGVDHPHVRALVDVQDLDGWEWRAAWDDFKLGLSHGREFTRVAVVGHSRWLDIGTRISSWFMPGEYRYFEELDTALVWLHS